jgi:hypothetical protein
MANQIYLYLASDASTFTTGAGWIYLLSRNEWPLILRADFIVDGGYTLP